MEERLQKLMSQAGIASRRDAEAYITAGRVTINGKIAKLGDKADPAQDDIRVDGARLRVSSERTYIALYKPMGVVTAVTAQSQEQRRTVRDLIPLEGHLFPVGRLDADSEGLVLLTDDGELAEKLTHPRYEHPKTYEVTLRGVMEDEQLEKWRRGIVLDDGPTLPAGVELVSRSKDFTQLRITMREGRNRQIRRVASLLGNPVNRLVRTHMGPLALGKLKPGEWRYLTSSEVTLLQKQTGVRARRMRRPAVTPGGKLKSGTPEEKRAARSRRRPAPQGRRAQRTADQPLKPRAPRPVRSQGGSVEKTSERPANASRKARRPAAGSSRRERE